MRFGVIIRVAFAMSAVCCGLAPASLSKDGGDWPVNTSVSIVSPSSEVCPVTVPNPEPTTAAPPDYLTTNYDFSGADQGISVNDPIHEVTWVFPGDSKSADANAWFGVYEPGAGGANVIERWFAQFTRKRVGRSAFPSVARLHRAIRDHLALPDASARPFVWTATAEEIRDRSSPGAAGRGSASVPSGRDRAGRA